MGKKTRNKTRLPLWERAQKEKEKLEKDQSQEATEDDRWWNDEWLDGREDRYGCYPLICRVERTHAEFPPDPSAEQKTVEKGKGEGIKVVFRAPEKADGKRKHPSLRLAVTLRPLTPLLPPQWQDGKLSDTSLTRLPPTFQVVICPSRADPYLLPFCWTYRRTHGLIEGAKVQIKSRTDGKATVVDLSFVPGCFGSGRLNDKTAYINEILSGILSGTSSSLDSSVLEHSLHCGANTKAKTLPTAEACVVLESLLAFSDVDKPSAPSTGGQQQKDEEGKLLRLIRATLPCWQSVSIRGVGKKNHTVSPWDLTMVKSPNSSRRSSFIGLLKLDLAPNGLLYTIEEPLRAKLECAVEDFAYDNTDSYVFFDPVTDDDAPGYSCAVPLSMCIQKILRRLGTGKSKEQRCYYRSVEGLLNDISTLLDNSLLYNSSESEVVASGMLVVPLLKRLVTQISSRHVREEIAREKADEDRRRRVFSQFETSPLVGTDNDGSVGRASGRQNDAADARKPFTDPLDRRLVEAVVPDMTWSSGNPSTPWVPQSGDFLLYSRSAHAKFVRAYHESLTTEQCVLPRFEPKFFNGQNIEEGGGPTHIENNTEETASDKLSNTLQTHWLVCKVAWVRAMFPRPRTKQSREKFDQACPILSIGLSFPYTWDGSSRTHTVFWRPCKTIEPNESLSSSRLCEACGCSEFFSFLIPAWVHGQNYEGVEESPNILTPDDGATDTKTVFARPPGFRPEEIAAIDRCLVQLKSRCLSNRPADNVDKKMTVENVKRGWRPSAAKVGKLPSFDRFLGIDTSPEPEAVKTSNRKSVKNRKLSNQENQKQAIAVLSQTHFLPPLLPDSTKKEPRKSATLAESLSPCPKACLELIQIRLRNGFYRGKSGLLNDIQEAYIGSCLLLLTMEASRKFGETISIRRVARRLASLDSVKMSKKKAESKESELGNSTEQALVDKLKLVRSLYAMALACAAETRFMEVVLGTKPNNNNKPRGPRKAVEQLPSSKEQAFKTARQKLGKLIAAIGRDECSNRVVSSKDVMPSVKVLLALGPKKARESLVVYTPDDYMASRSLIPVLFGKPGRMTPCARCQVYRRSMLVCRVQKAHSNADFNWLETFRGTGGLNGLLYTLKTGEVVAEDADTMATADAQTRATLIENDDSESQEGDGAPDDELTRATNSITLARSLLERAKAEEVLPLRLGNEFVRNFFPVDPADGHYNYCIICGTSGDVMCCEGEGCPNVAHPKCAGFEATPEDDWFCEKCSRKKAVPPGEVQAEDEDLSSCVLSTEGQLDKLREQLTSLRAGRQRPKQPKQADAEDGASEPFGEGEAIPRNGQDRDTPNEESPLKVESTASTKEEPLGDSEDNGHDNRPSRQRSTRRPPKRYLNEPSPSNTDDSQEPAKRRRGRPRKERIVHEPASSQERATAKHTGKEPVQRRQRGRPPKRFKEDQTSEEGEPERTRLLAKHSGDETELPSRRRGRPTKRPKEAQAKGEGEPKGRSPASSAVVETTTNLGVDRSIRRSKRRRTHAKQQIQVEMNPTPIDATSKSGNSPQRSRRARKQPARYHSAG